jgi:hypothetical protein
MSSAPELWSMHVSTTQALNPAPHSPPPTLNPTHSKQDAAKRQEIHDNLAAT